MSLRRSSRFASAVCVIALVVGTLTPVAFAERICGVDALIGLSGVPVLPFGGEVLGAATIEGTVASATVEIVFTATGSFDAADVTFLLCLPIDGSGACHGVSGSELGWSGQGTFTAELETNALDGDLALVDGAFYTWFGAISNTNPGAGPITGTIDVWTYALHMTACPVGDLDGDIEVGFDDLVMLLSDWGPCPRGARSCAGDLDDDGTVGFSDVVILLANWGDFFCPAPLC